MKKIFTLVSFLVLSTFTIADSISFGLTDDNYDHAEDWGFVEAAIDINDTTRIIVGGGANIGAFDADHAAYLGGEIDYNLFKNFDLTGRAIYISNEVYELGGLRTDFGFKYKFNRTSFYSRYRTLPNTFIKPGTPPSALDPKHKIIFGALHNFNKTFAAGIDTTMDRVNKAYFKINF
jgi:hypothetical protein